MGAEWGRRRPRRRRGLGWGWGGASRRIDPLMSSDLPEDSSPPGGEAGESSGAGEAGGVDNGLQEPLSAVLFHVAVGEGR